MILHIDGDAFFAACEQAMHPEWKGLPVVTGVERGIVSAASYEAKARGIGRGVALWEVKKLCPEAILVASDYDAYMMYSRRMYAIVRRYASVVEEYSIDEAFADITGMNVPMRMSYEGIARKMQDEIQRELDISVSIGVAETKTLAKVGSKWKKPHGVVVIMLADSEAYLRELPVEKVWGIGSRYAKRCALLGVHTAFDLISKPRGWVTTHFEKPFLETWMELRGEKVFDLIQTRPIQASIQKTRTFTPPTLDKEEVFSHLLKNFENACIKARRCGLVAKEAVIFLKTQEFRYVGTDFSFVRATAYPHEAALALRNAFEVIHKPRTKYRATGITLLGLVGANRTQLSMFEAVGRTDAMRRVYKAVDAVAEKFGKHAVHLADSWVQLGGERGAEVARHEYGAGMMKLSLPKASFKIPILQFECT